MNVRVVHLEPDGAGEGGGRRGSYEMSECLTCRGLSQLPVRTRHAHSTDVALQKVLEKAKWHTIRNKKWRPLDPEPPAYTLAVRNKGIGDGLSSRPVTGYPKIRKHSSTDEDVKPSETPPPPRVDLRALLRKSVGEGEVSLEVRRPPVEKLSIADLWYRDEHKRRHFPRYRSFTAATSRRGFDPCSLQSELAMRRAYVRVTGEDITPRVQPGGRATRRRSPLILRSVKTAPVTLGRQSVQRSLYSIDQHELPPRTAAGSSFTRPVTTACG